MGAKALYLEKKEDLTEEAVCPALWFIPLFVCGP